MQCNIYFNLRKERECRRCQNWVIVTDCWIRGCCVCDGNVLLPPIQTSVCVQEEVWLIFSAEEDYFPSSVHWFLYFMFLFASQICQKIRTSNPETDLVCWYGHRVKLGVLTVMCFCWDYTQRPDQQQFPIFLVLSDIQRLTSQNELSKQNNPCTL